jgi:hypothetical protein
MCHHAQALTEVQCCHVVLSHILHGSRRKQWGSYVMMIGSSPHTSYYSKAFSTTTEKTCREAQKRWSVKNVGNNMTLDTHFLRKLACKAHGALHHTVCQC